MKTEVIILAQGTQKRLGMRFGYKQLLPLPECGGIPIMVRTVTQCDTLLHGGSPVSVVATAAVAEMTPHQAWILASHDAPPRSTRLKFTELPDPGNSSLKGIARYLEQARAGASHSDLPERTIVLLGDVVYSWACLRAIWARSETCGWVGTSDLSASGGELWGVAWARHFEDEMMRMLRDALLRHPPFEDEYQPGQLRRWITGWRRGDLRDHVAEYQRTGRYVTVDDYTHDIDLPSDIALLPELSRAAAEDDRLNWPVAT